MKILIAEVRKVPRRNEFRMKLAYRKGDQSIRSQSALFDTRKKAENMLAFRVAGLSNGG